VKARLDAGDPYTVRFKVPRGRVVAIDDAVRGHIEWDVQATVGDFILLRSSEGGGGGMPVYNFCVAVDDAQMEVSTVIRAEEHLTNTVRQVLILEALGYTPPQYAHLALVLGEDRSKLSKRHGATSVNQFKLDGFLPEAMINYLCNLGWNDGTDQEIYTVAELQEAFSLDRITKSPAVFDMKKLRWVNGQHLRALPEERLGQLVGEQLVAAGVCEAADGPFVGAATRMVREKVELVNDAEPIVRQALGYPLLRTLEAESARAVDGLHEVSAAVIAAHKAGSLPAFEGADAAAEWKTWSKALGKELGRKGKGLFMPLRIAFTGTMAGPDVPAQLEVLSLAPGQVASEFVPLADRLATLEGALASMPEPAAAA